MDPNLLKLFLKVSSVARFGNPATYTLHFAWSSYLTDAEIVDYFRYNYSSVFSAPF